MNAPVDLLSRLLSLIPVSGVLDERCHFGAPWEIAQSDAAKWVIPYHVLLAGEAVLDCGNGVRHALSAGDIVIFPAGGAHRLHDGSGAAPSRSLRQTSDAARWLSVNEGEGARTEILCGRFLVGAMPDRLLRDYLPGQLIVRRAQSPAADDRDPSLTSPMKVSGERLDRLIHLMKEEVVEAKPGSKTMLGHLSAALFALTLRFASVGPNPPRGLLALCAHSRLHAAISAMFEHPERAWSLEQFASLCDMSKATFVRQFRDAIGRSAIDLLTEVRMTLAGRMLQHSQTSIAEVGETVGYQSVAAFQRVFKRSIGMSPARYRASVGCAIS